MKKNSRPLKQDRMRREDRSAESKRPKQLQGRRHRQDMIAMTCLEDLLRAAISRRKLFGDGCDGHL